MDKRSQDVHDIARKCWIIVEMFSVTLRSLTIVVSVTTVLTFICSNVEEGMVLRAFNASIYSFVIVGCRIYTILKFRILCFEFIVGLPVSSNVLTHQITRIRACYVDILASVSFYVIDQPCRAFI